MRLTTMLARTTGAVLLLLGCAATAQAQGRITAGLGASINILFAPLSGAGVRPIDFGTVVPGVPLAVQPRTAQGGEFRITGTSGRKSLDIIFVLPTVLTNAKGATIPIDFNGNYAALCELNVSGVCDVPSIATWNPVTTPLFADKPTRYKGSRPRYNVDQFAVYIGGRILPAAGQVAGHYTGNVGVLMVLN